MKAVMTGQNTYPMHTRPPYFDLYGLIPAALTECEFDVVADKVDATAPIVIGSAQEAVMLDLTLGRGQCVHVMRFITRGGHQRLFVLIGPGPNPPARAQRLPRGWHVAVDLRAAWVGADEPLHLLMNVAPASLRDWAS